MSLCKSRSRENITAAAIVPFIEEQPTENKKLRIAKEKLRIFFDAGFVSRFRGGFAHGEKRAKHEKEQKQQQGEGEG